MNNFEFLAQICPKKDLGLETEKSNVGTKINIVETVCQFSAKLDNFDFFGPNLPKNGFWGRSFKNLSPDSEYVLPRYHMYQFSVKTDSFDFFGPNLPKKEITIWNSEN